MEQIFGQDVMLTISNVDRRDLIMLSLNPLADIFVHLTSV